LTLSKKQLFERNFGKHIQISPAAFSFLNERFVEKEYNAREFIVEAGTVARYFYFVVSGVQTLYILNQKGEKLILGFSFTGSQSGIYDSFIKNSPSVSFLEAITPTRMIAIDRSSFLELFEEFPEFYKWRAHFMEEILFGRLQRETELTNMSARERFQVFFDRCPPELRDIPQHYLAGYLNMKPETLSRLRSMRD
jgi:CRP-like cAMP-binding protein